MPESPVKQKDVFIDRDKGQINARGTSGKIAFGEEGSYPDFPGLRWRTFQFENIDASEKDGAIGVLEPKSRIPIELVRADKTFSEVPLLGNLIFLHYSNRGKMSAYHFDGSRDTDYAFLFEVSRGDFLCWVNISEGDKAEFLEYEEPGFSPDDLGIEDLASGNIANTDVKIPGSFRNLVKQIESNGLEHPPIPIVELNIL